MLVSNFARAFSAGQRLFEILDYKSPVQESANASALLVSPAASKASIAAPYRSSFAWS